MSKFQSFAFVASVVGAALMTGAASAQTAAPVPPAPVANAPSAAAPVAKAQKKLHKEAAKESDVVCSCRGHKFALRRAQ